MEVKWVYIKKRAKFGKQCFFDDDVTTFELVEEDKTKRVAETCNRASQACVTKQFAGHEINTEKKVYRSTGVVHTEGGWPKELNPRDEEAVARFRRRVEKADNWAPKMTELVKPIERCIEQNNAVDIYEKFFDGERLMEMVKPVDVRTVNTYVDPQKITRPITHISWSKDYGNRMAVSYCSVEFEKKPNESLYSYIWDVENSSHAYMALKASHALATVEFNPRDPSTLIGGLTSGLLCVWDIRVGNTPVTTSHPKYSHRNYANLALWINSKTFSEFFSASSGGSIMWWDYRKLRQPTEVLIMDLEDPLRADIVRAVGVSAIQFESTMGTKFMVGLQNGVVISGNRKGQTAQQKMALRFNCHYGPVHSVERHPFSAKHFLTVDGDSAKLWAEDTKENYLLKIPARRGFFTRGCWSNSRQSVFYVITADGDLEVFDILAGTETPVKTLKLGEGSLKAIAAHEQGRFLATGGQNGTVYLCESSEALVTGASNEKVHLHSYLEHCSRFQKAIDSRLKEMRLAQRATEEMAGHDTAKKEVPSDAPKPKHGVKADKQDKAKPDKTQKKKPDDDPDLARADEVYQDILQKEMAKYQNVGGDTGSGTMMDDRKSEKADKKGDKDKKDKGKKDKGKPKEVVEKPTEEIVVMTRREYEQLMGIAQSEPEDVDIEMTDESEADEEALHPTYRKAAPLDPLKQPLPESVLSLAGIAESSNIRQKKTGAAFSDLDESVARAKIKLEQWREKSHRDDSSLKAKMREIKSAKFEPPMRRFAGIRLQSSIRGSVSSLQCRRVSGKEQGMKTLLDRPPGEHIRTKIQRTRRGIERQISGTAGAYPRLSAANFEIDVPKLKERGKGNLPPTAEGAGEGL